MDQLMIKSKTGRWLLSQLIEGFIKRSIKFPAKIDVRDLTIEMNEDSGETNGCINLRFQIKNTDLGDIVKKLNK